MKKGFIITAVILIVLGIALFACAGLACGFDFSKLDTSKYETKTIDVSESFDGIQISADEADISFRHSEDGKTSLECVEREGYETNAAVENGTLKITSERKAGWIDRLTFSFKPTSIILYLPSDSYESLAIKNSTGDADIPERFSFGSAEIITSTGDVEFAASVDGQLKIKTNTGDITLRGVKAESAALSVTTGRVEAENLECAGAVTIEVDTGRTELTNVTCKTLDSTGDTGRITLTNTVVSDGMTIQRSTGDVRFNSSDAAQITVKTSTGDVSGTLRTEKVFVARSSTGSIKVPDTVTGGKCEITTSTGDIEITIG